LPHHDNAPAHSSLLIRSHQTWDDARPPASVLVRPCTSGHSSLHHAEIRPERATKGLVEIIENSLAELHSFPKLEETLGATYKKWRGVLRRGRSPTASKWVND
jgi:hypothetical protein